MLFGPPIPQPRPPPLLLKYLSRRQSGPGKEAHERRLMPTFTPADGRQSESLMSTGIGSDEGTNGEGRQFRSKFPHPYSELRHKIGTRLPHMWLLARKQISKFILHLLSL